MLALKIYGYENQDTDTLLTLREVTFEITSEHAKRIGEFFLKCVKEMNEKPEWEHEHLNGGDIPDVIIYKARNS